MAFGWSVAEALLTNVFNIMFSDAGEELEIKDLVDAGCNIFQLFDWCCIVGLVMENASISAVIDRAGWSKKGSKAGGAKDEGSGKGEERVDNRKMILAVIAVKLCLFPFVLEYFFLKR
jgi:hypothetical protein